MQRSLQRFKRKREDTIILQVDDEFNVILDSESISQYCDLYLKEHDKITKEFKTETYRKEIIDYLTSLYSIILDQES